MEQQYALDFTDISWLKSLSLVGGEEGEGGVGKSSVSASASAGAEPQWEALSRTFSAEAKWREAFIYMWETGGEPRLWRWFWKELEEPAEGGAREVLCVQFVDAAPESPAGRRSLCYDKAARVGRKKAAPLSSAWEEAEQRGLRLLTEEEYRQLQDLWAMDLKTSSWLWTPEEMRGLGGALFGDRRFNRVFFYHNGADSYYAARGFRTVLELQLPCFRYRKTDSE